MPYVPPTVEGKWLAVDQLAVTGIVMRPDGHVWQHKWRCSSCDVLWYDEADRDEPGTCWLCGSTDTEVWTFGGRPWVYEWKGPAE